jgi:hypothetical protein
MVYREQAKRLEAYEQERLQRADELEQKRLQREQARGAWRGPRGVIMGSPNGESITTST